MSKFVSFLLAGVCLPYCAAMAQQASTSLPTVEVYADREAKPAANASLNTTVVTRGDIANFSPRTNDAAQMLSNTPGLSFYTGGGVSSLPVIHGFNDDRNTIVLGGIPITASCANHMNPPLSYIDPGAIGSVEVITANVPVSKGGDAIGGSIIVLPRAPVFATPASTLVTKGPAPVDGPQGPGVIASGSISSSFRSNGGGFRLSGHANVATDHFALDYDGSWAKSGDYHAGGGAKILSTMYDAENHVARLSYKNDDQLISFRYTYQNIPYQGFPNQQMDMLGNNANTFDLSYKGGFDWGRLEANAYYHVTQHYMNFLTDRGFGPPTPTTGMPMYVNDQDYGYKIKAETNVSKADLIRVGNELHMQRMNEWWTGMAMMAPWMGPNNFINLNNAQRNVLSTYAEWEHRWNKEWSSLIGLRNDTVWMNAGNVQGYDNVDCAMGGPPGCGGAMNVLWYQTDSAAFNAADRARTFVNFDVTALTRYNPSDAAAYEFGYTLKQRAPSIYELYAWSSGMMSSEMIGWFGDGNGYVGNLNLKPETAHTISLTGQWSDPTKQLWTVKATPYYSYVENYIDVDMPATINGHANTGMALQFANHDAQLAGFDLSGRALVLPGSAIGDVSISGVAGYNYGRRLDGYYLYHMMPFNAKAALEDAVLVGGGKLTGAFEVRAVAAKTDVETLRNEPSTPAFAVMNLRGSYEYQNLRFDFGVENLADKLYYEPLGGIDIADNEGRGTPWGLPLAAMGRNIYGGMTVKF